jgi:hypothetical protein
MKNRTFLIASIVLGLAFILAGCKPEATVEDIYWDYWQACADGDFAAAKLLLSADAIAVSETLGVCAFTHDAINTVEAQQGNPARAFSQDPEINTRESVASLTWIDDQGNLAIVTLVAVDGGWKINQANWSR